MKALKHSLVSTFLVLTFPLLGQKNVKNNQTTPSTPVWNSEAFQTYQLSFLNYCP